MSNIKRKKVKEKSEIDIEWGMIDSIITQLQTLKNEGFIYIQKEDCGYNGEYELYAIRERDETEEELKKRLAEKRKQKEEKEAQKIERRKLYEKLKREFEI